MKFEGGNLRVRIVAKIFLIAFAMICAGGKLTAQEKPQEKPATVAPAAAAIPAANPKDVDTIDAIMAALYNVISGPAGERDWNRFRSLFLPEARMGAVRKKPDGAFSASSFTPDGYVERAGSYFEHHG